VVVLVRSPDWKFLAQPVKVLVISYYSLAKHTGTGIVFSNLFSSISATDIAQVYGEATPPNSLTCSRSFRLSGVQIPMVRFTKRVLHWVSRDYLSKNQPSGFAAGTLNRGYIFNGLKEAWADMLPFVLDQNFWSWLKEFNPDVIFTNMGHIRWMKCALSVSKYLDIPIVPFFNDDWPSTHYAGSSLTSIPRLILLKKLTQILKRSPMGLGASDEMAEEYSNRYGIRFEPMLPMVDVSREFGPHNRESSSDVVEVVYVGGLHLKRYEGLHVVGSIIAKLRHEGLNCSFKIYCPKTDAVTWGEQTVVPGSSSIAGSLRYEDVAVVLNKADILVFVESPEKELRRYTRLSFSTKIAQYLAAGRPIVAYGPDEVASCRYISKTGSGIVVGSGSEDGLQLEQALRKLIVSDALREKLGRQAWTTARQRHESSIQCERFKQIFTRVAERKP
jgi:glycosyltransferase involved in cell wall biosynthesis